MKTDFLVKWQPIDCQGPQYATIETSETIIHNGPLLLRSAKDLIRDTYIGMCVVSIDLVEKEDDMGMTVNEAGKLGGKSKSPIKEEKARKNGKRGGAPEGNHNNPPKVKK